MLGQGKSKFGIDVVWNLGSFVLAGIVFILINTILLWVYGKEAVGVFTQAYAWYIVLSQLAVSGVHLSVQYYIPKYNSKKAHSDHVLTAALAVTTLFSLVIIGIAYIFSDVPGRLMQSQGLSDSFPYVIWGLLFFSLNKVLLAYHNGFRRMKAFATFNFIRVAGMLGALGIFILVVKDATLIPSLLAWAELLLFVVLMAYTLRFYTIRLGKRFQSWVRLHFVYGMRALLGNFLLDLNTRVDVIMLGFFLSDERVGVYSYALAIAEGVMQIPVIFRNNINPIITKAHNSPNRVRLLNQLLKKNVRAFYKLIGAMALVTIALFPIGLWALQVDDVNHEYWKVYALLIGGMVLAAGYLPFQMLFNQLGRPKVHTYYVFLVFIVNVAANLILIQYFEIYGAGMGTALSIVSQVVFLKWLVGSKTAYHI